MAEIKETSKGLYDVYDYVFSLEEQLKTLKTEKQMNFAKKNIGKKVIISFIQLAIDSPGDKGFFFK